MNSCSRDARKVSLPIRTRHIISLVEHTCNFQREIHILCDEHAQPEPQPLQPNRRCKFLSIVVRIWGFQPDLRECCVLARVEERASTYTHKHALQRVWSNSWWPVFTFSLCSTSLCIVLSRVMLPPRHPVGISPPQRLNNPIAMGSITNSFDWQTVLSSQWQLKRARLFSQSQAIILIRYIDVFILD